MGNPVLATPVYTDLSKHQFVSESLVSPTEVEMDGVRFKTAPLLFGKEICLLGISDSNELQELGITDPSDSLDVNAGIKSVYVELASGEIAEVNVSDNVKFKTKPGNDRELEFDVNISFVPLNSTNAITFTLKGKLCTELGTIVVDFTCLDTSVTYLGYVPEVYRVNYNR